MSSTLVDVEREKHRHVASDQPLAHLMVSDVDTLEKMSRSQSVKRHKPKRSDVRTASPDEVRVESLRFLRRIAVRTD